MQKHKYYFILGISIFSINTNLIFIINITFYFSSFSSWINLIGSHSRRFIIIAESIGWNISAYIMLCRWVNTTADTFFPSIEKNSATEYDCMSEATSPFPNYIAGSQNFVHFKLIRYSEPTSAVSTNLELYFFANLEAITINS